MQHVEEEAPTSTSPTVMGGAGMQDIAEGSLTKILIAGLISAFTMVLGIVIKNKRSGQALEDATNSITVETVKSLRSRVSELEGVNRQLMIEVGKATHEQISADGRAQRASIQAGIAKDAADRANIEAQESTRRLNIQLAYVRTLKSLLTDHGIQPPPEPTMAVHT